MHSRHIRLDLCNWNIVEESNYQRRLSFWRKSIESPNTYDNGKIIQSVWLSFNHKIITESSIISSIIHRNISMVSHHIFRSFIIHLIQISHSSGCQLAWSSNGPFSSNYVLTNHWSSSNSCSFFAMCFCTSNIIFCTWII